MEKCEGFHIMKVKLTDGSPCPLPSPPPPPPSFFLPIILVVLLRLALKSGV